MNSKTDKGNSSVNDGCQNIKHKKCVETNIYGENSNKQSKNDQSNENDKPNKYQPRDFCVSTLCEEGGCLWQWRSVFVIDQTSHKNKCKRIMPTKKNATRIDDNNDSKK